MRTQTEAIEPCKFLNLLTLVGGQAFGTLQTAGVILLTLFIEYHDAGWDSTAWDQHLFRSFFSLFFGACGAD